MKSDAQITLTGSDLTIDQIIDLVANPKTKVAVSQKSISGVKKTYSFVKEHAKSEIIYGVNTGFGPMAGRVVGSQQLIDLQYNLIRSHAVGMGNPLPPSYVLAAMIVRLNTLAKGFSGVSPELLKHLEAFINHRIIPVVPEHGAVGTSGDLVQLAHIALALIGEGEAFYKGKRKLVTTILKEVNIQPYSLQPKEGLSLINGTAMMTGIGALICADAQKLLDLEVRSGAFALELVHAFTDSLNETLHAIRPHTGQSEIAKKLRTLTNSSKLLRTRKNFTKQFNINGDVQQLPEIVQEVYSLRCIPQILGPIYDTLLTTKKVIETEMNSVTDNPIVDVDNEVFIHGGNFHGDYVAATLDQLKMTLIKLTMLSERRINFFLNENVNKTFPPFLNLAKPGLTLSLQGLQFVATSTTARSQTLAFPQYVHSIPTNADNQDVVSMGTDAALITQSVIDNAYIVLIIELVVLSQAADCTPITAKELCVSSQELYSLIRKFIKTVRTDSSLSNQLNRLVDTFRQWHSQ